MARGNKGKVIAMNQANDGCSLGSSSSTEQRKDLLKRYWSGRNGLHTDDCLAWTTQWMVVPFTEQGDI